MRRAAAGVAFLLALGGCAPEPKLSWDALGQAREPARTFVPPPASGLPPSDRPPKATAYPSPPGSKLVFTGDGPVDPLPLQASAFAAQALGGGYRILAVQDADADGDGEEEAFVLAAAESGGGFAVAALSRARGGVLARHAIAPPVDRGGSCHLEVRLLGILHSAAGALPLVSEERGVGCGAFEGGGFERWLHVLRLEAGEFTIDSVMMGGMRMIRAGAVDAYDAAAWVVTGSDGFERILVRGIWQGRRSCASKASPHWVEELAFRVLDGGGVSVFLGGERVSLQEGVLPPELLRSHASPCS